MSVPEYAPSRSEVESYRELGFLVTPPLFDADRLLDVSARISSAWESRTQQIAASSARGAASMADYSRVRPELQRLHLDDPVLSDFCRDPALVRVARALVGADVDLSWNQAYTKLAGGDRRTAIPWHQDDYYARIDGARINCWVAISKATQENGTIVRAARKSRVLPHDWDAELLFYRCAVDEADAAVVELAPGQVFVFDGALPHRSGVNVSSASRVSYSISFSASDARLVANGEAFGDRVPVLRGGESADEAILAYARDPSDAGHAGARVVAEILARAPRRGDEIRDALAALGRESGAEERSILARLVATLPDSDEVLGDLVRSRARVDQLMREVASARGSTSVERALLERVLVLEPDHAEARARLARLA